MSRAERWALESAVERNARPPDSFQIPDEDARRSVRPGQGVKLLFRIRGDDGEEGVERMRVLVTGRRGDAWTGRLQNRARSLEAPAPGVEVTFRAEHVADIEDPPADYRPR